MRRLVSIHLSIAAVVGMVGCASSGADRGELRIPPRQGSLLMVGGAERSENRLLHTRMMELGGPGASVAVIPVASGVPEESGPETVQDYQSHGVAAELIDINFRAPEEAANPLKAQAIRSHRSIFFTGGDQARIVDAFRPATGDTVGYGALWSVLDADGAIGGTSAGAAMMSDPCIRGGISSEALLTGLVEVPDRGVRVGRGMGFFPYGTTDQHFIRRGRLGRLVVALMESGVDRGYGIEEDHALQVDLETHQILALSEGRAALVADVSEATKSGLARTGIRLSLLSGGDQVNGLTGSMTVDAASGRVLVDSSSLAGSVSVFEGSIWSEQAVANAIATMVLTGRREVRSSDEHFDVTFSTDSRTRLYVAPGGSDAATLDVSAFDLRMDILPRASAEAARAALLAELSTPVGAN